ncbi:ABC transporter substrate-binding protein [Magnetospirillum sp. UT-4]|uniref:ABC transporter substrate-binding protein n=1 Tax=Magnetospirillum sp. UT-4 TaxID=2681467 RepID=UPI00137FBDB1|nr:ABC transporter substrate-binding protein [Magnetospirillum sp. UT-4]CAA7626466.1 Extracellular ligand-binding receptor [Magnetospirillum sp. UT-4]
MCPAGFRRLLSALVAVVLMPLSAGAAEPIRIGAFLSVTGVMSLMGDPEKKALEMEIEAINAAGGVLGRRLDLVSYDDGSDPEKAVTSVKRLIENDRVDVVLGGSGTPTSLAVLGLMEKASMPYISMGGGVGIVEPVRKWSFKVPPTDRMAAEKVFLDLKRRGLTRLALLSENVGFGKSGRDQSLALAPAYGIEIVADESYGPKDPDVTPQLTRIRAAKGAQALFVFGTGMGPAVVTRNIRQLGLQLPVYQSHGIASKEFLRLVGAAADGTRLPASALVIADRLHKDDPQAPVVQAFKAAFEARTGQDVSMLAGHAHDALHLYLEAVKRAGSTDKVRVRDEIERTSGFIGTAGAVTMSPTDHMGLGLKSFHLVEVVKGEFVPVE